MDIKYKTYVRLREYTQYTFKKSLNMKTISHEHEHHSTALCIPCTAVMVNKRNA